jgi:hypothetical protein
MFENKALRRIFECKRVLVTGGLGHCRMEALRDLCSLPNIVKAYME